MLRLRSCILTSILSSPASSTVPPLRRLLAAAAAAPAAASPSPSFAVDQYLVDTCGLTRAQALKASAKLSHLKSPSKPDAALAFLAGLGLSSADVAALVVKDPQFLCAGVETILAPNLAGLTALGLSYTEITRLLSRVPFTFRQRSIISNLPYCLALFGSYENVFRAIKSGSNLLLSDLENTVKPAVKYLQGCGLAACDIAKLCINAPWIIGTKRERLQAMVASAEALGVPRGSSMFRHALHAVNLLSEEKVAARVDNLKNTFRWSDAEVRIAFCKFPRALTMSRDMLQSKSEFLISEVGLEPAYIAHRPAMISYSLEGRLRPRYYVVKFLKDNGLLHRNRDYYAAAMRAEKVFLDKYIHPYKETAPHLAQDYADACRGEIPTRFRFT